MRYLSTAPRRPPPFLRVQWLALAATVGLAACSNATSLPVERAVAGSIPARAAAFGIPGGTYDGMDPVIVFRATLDAVTRARGGGGPTFLEFSTYRFDVHHTFEFRAGLRYRAADEVARWRARDPPLSTTS